MMLSCYDSRFQGFVILVCHLRTMYFRLPGLVDGRHSSGHVKIKLATVSLMLQHCLGKWGPFSLEKKVEMDEHWK